MEKLRLRELVDVMETLRCPKEDNVLDMIVARNHSGETLSDQ